jgi:hypothetical protein
MIAISNSLRDWGRMSAFLSVYLVDDDKELSDQSMMEVQLRASLLAVSTSIVQGVVVMMLMPYFSWSCS